jgi:hypothetical protein
MSMKTESVKTTVHSTLHNNDVIYVWHRQLNSDEVARLFEEHEQLLFDRLPRDPLNVVLRGDSFEQAVANLEIIR